MHAYNKKIAMKQMVFDKINLKVDGIPLSVWFLCIQYNRARTGKCIWLNEQRVLLIGFVYYRFLAISLTGFHFQILLFFFLTPSY